MRTFRQLSFPTFDGVASLCAYASVKCVCTGCYDGLVLLHPRMLMIATNWWLRLLA